MPTYDYECQKCTHTFEAFHGMSDDPLENCPLCGGRVKRLIGGGLGIIFKGSGFYVTDNKSASNPAAPTAKKSEGDNSSPGKDSSENKSEKKEKKEKVTASTTD